MSIYIKDMQMPKGKPICIIIDPAGQVRCYDLDNDKYANDELFEAIYVPQHGNLKDADAVERNLLKMQQAQTGPCSHGVRKSRAVLRDAPIIIPTDSVEKE